MHLGGSKNANSHISLCLRLCKDKKVLHCVLLEQNYSGEDYPHTPEFNPPSDGEYLCRPIMAGKLVLLNAPVITSSPTFISQMLEVWLRSERTERISWLIGPVWDQQEPWSSLTQAHLRSAEARTLLPFLHIWLRTQGQVVQNRFTTTVNFLTDSNKDNSLKGDVSKKRFCFWETEKAYTTV